MTPVAPVVMEPAQVAEQAKRLFSSSPWPGRWIQRYRPRICPFDELIPHFPLDGKVLDVGCGSGLLLGLLAVNGRIRCGLGFDANEKAIGIAKQMAAGLSPNLGKRLSFVHLDARAPWPDGTFDVVALVDVMHHVQPSAQKNVFASAVAKIASKGRLVYKDMAVRPAWSAWANRLHDLVMAREWIHYCPIQEVEKWGLEAGFALAAKGRTRRLCYTHEYLIMENPK